MFEAIVLDRQITYNTGNPDFLILDITYENIYFQPGQWQRELRVKVNHNSGDMVELKANLMREKK